MDDGSYRVGYGATHHARRAFRATALGLVTSLSIAASATGALQQTSLDSLIAAQMEAFHIPGLAAAAVDSGEVVWIGTYGWADVDARRPVAEDTPFMIASVSKTLTATVLMSLHADGRFGLDDDVNRHLPFRVRNPNHPAVPITIRQLLRHRSSLRDNGAFYGPHWSQANGDPTTVLGDYLRSYLSVEGADYDAEANFLPDEPDTTFRYCNTCYALLGHLAEAISGRPFERLSEEVLFHPLEMTNTAWFIRDLPGRELAMPYRHAADSGFVAYGQNGYPDWPAGQLRSSIRDLSRFLAVYAGGGELDGAAVIPPSTVETLSPSQAALGFHTWFQMATSNRDVLYQHGGGDIGVSTVMGFRRGTGRGVVVLTNGEAPLAEIMDAIYVAIDSLKTADNPRPD